MDIEDFGNFKIELHYIPVIKDTCEELANDIKQSALSTFDGKGDYANSWVWKMQDDKIGEYGVVYNKEHYRLTHLLENGHLIKNAYGSYGRTAPRPHIKPAYDKIKVKFIEEMAKIDYEIK